MNRAGILSIVLAAAVTGACGGADGASSSPTGPSSTTPTTSSQPAHGVMRAGKPDGQRFGLGSHAPVVGSERRDRVFGSRRLDSEQFGSAVHQHDEQQLHLDGEARPAVRPRSSQVRRPVWRVVERSRLHRRRIVGGLTGSELDRPIRWTVLIDRFGVRPGSDPSSARVGLGLSARRGPWPKARDRRFGPEIDVVEALKESFSGQRVKCLGATAFIE